MISTEDNFGRFSFLNEKFGESCRMGKRRIMIEEPKTLKQYCKEAKKRLKQGFWQNYHERLDKEIERAEQSGVLVSKVKEFYASKVIGDLKNPNEEKENFYKRVKDLLDAEGEVANAIGRLTDVEYYKTLSYDEQQRYNLSLSEKYLQAVERYKKEKAVNYKG